MIAEQVCVEGENFVGLLGFASDGYAVVSPAFELDEVLGVPTLKTKVYGTGLVGMFCTGNSNGILLPYFVTDNEYEAITRFAKRMGINAHRLNDKYTAVGNMIAVNDKKAYVSEVIRDYKAIEDTLDVEAFTGSIGGRIEVGAFLFATNKGFLAHPDAERHLAEIKAVLGVPGNIGTVNCGVPYVKSGLIANSNGYVTGAKTTGIEMQRIEDALGLV